MSFASLRRRVQRIECEIVPRRDRTGRLIELVALARLRAAGHAAPDLSLRTEAELLAIVGMESREEFRAALPALSEALAREKERRGLEPKRD